MKNISTAFKFQVDLPRQNLCCLDYKPRSNI